MNSIHNMARTSFLLFLFTFTLLSAQTDKLLKKANEYSENNRFHLAIPIYQDILKFEPNHPKANLGLGLCYLEVVDKRIAYIYLQKAYQSNLKSPDIELNLARAYQYADKFAEATTLFAKILEQTDQLKENYRYKYLQKKIAECETATVYIAEPVDAKIENIGAIVNSKYHDYAPVLSLDESKLVFTSRRIGSSDNNVTEDGDYYEDIYISYKLNGNWTEPLNMGKNVNTQSHDAAISISPDGYHVFIYRDDNGGDIYVTNYESKEWSQPVNFSKKINTKYNESSITMTADEKTIYFTSDKPGGYGGKDIYSSKKDEKGNWSDPKNMGSIINTPYDDDAPFIHQDAQTLYFSSRGHKTMGGYDIFRSEFINDKWSMPENLGYPINSTDDDIYFMISPDNKRGYYSSVKENGLGESDIYLITMPKRAELKPFISITPTGFNIPKPYDRHLFTASRAKIAAPFTIYKGKIMEDVTKTPLNANLTIIDGENADLISTLSSDKEGNYEIALLSGYTYAVRVEKQDYLFYSDNIQIPQASDYQLLLKDIYLQKMQVGAKVVLKNIFFETNKSALQPYSTTELDKLYGVLTENPKMKVEISGHTDNQGSTDYNKKLSAGRAKAVTDYLIRKGIVPERLKYAGYGKDRPVADNESEIGRQLNRRTEFEIIGN